MKALIGWIMVFAVLIGSWYLLAPLREHNYACHDQGGQPWIDGSCFQKMEVKK